MKFEVEGLDTLRAALESLDPVTAEAYLESGVREGALKVLNRTIAKAPGKIKNGLKLSSVEVDKRGVISMNVKLTPDTKYGVPVELGHQLFAWGHRTNIQIPERPYMRPAADESVDDVEEAAVMAVNMVLDIFGRK